MSTNMIGIGDVLHDGDPEPPIGTVVQLWNEERWKRVGNPRGGPCSWSVDQEHASPVRSWHHIMLEGAVVVTAVPAKPTTAPLMGRNEHADGDQLGFTGLVATGVSPEVAWQEMKDRCSDPQVRAVFEHMGTTEAGRRALEHSREQWAAHGLPIPWEQTVSDTQQEA
jgi:hypothetical protein